MLLVLTLVLENILYTDTRNCHVPLEAQLLSHVTLNGFTLLSTNHLSLDSSPSLFPAEISNFPLETLRDRICETERSLRPGSCHFGPRRERKRFLRGSRVPAVLVGETRLCCQLPVASICEKRIGFPLPAQSLERTIATRTKSLIHTMAKKDGEFKPKKVRSVLCNSCVFLRAKRRFSCVKIPCFDLSTLAHSLFSLLFDTRLRRRREARRSLSRVSCSSRRNTAPRSRKTIPRSPLGVLERSSARCGVRWTKRKRLPTRNARDKFQGAYLLAGGEGTIEVIFRGNQ